MEARKVILVRSKLVPGESYVFKIDGASGPGRFFKGTQKKIGTIFPRGNSKYRVQPRIEPPNLDKTLIDLENQEGFHVHKAVWHAIQAALATRE